MQLYCLQYLQLFAIYYCNYRQFMQVLQLSAIYTSIGLHLRDHLLCNLEEEYYMILDIFITRDAPY